MVELKVGERVAITLKAVENYSCKGCYFEDKEEKCPYTCLGKKVIYKAVKEQSV